ncbi:MAG: hypothetical protein ACI358_03610 [Candidatus Limimorpha sp.]
MPATVHTLPCEPLLESLGKLNLDDIGCVIVGEEIAPKNPVRCLDGFWI